MAKIVLERIICNVQESKHSSIVVDETSDICRTEQVAVCLRYVFEGDTGESFVGFYSTPSTEGETLFELVKDVFRKLGLSLEKVVAECFDGASNMSGVHRGLAARKKVCSPLAIYIHCYGHLLNLAIQDTMAEIEPLRTHWELFKAYTTLLKVVLNGTQCFVTLIMALNLCAHLNPKV